MNGITECNNAAIGRIRANARGFHDPHAFITMIMLDPAGIAPDCPGRPRHDPRNPQLSGKTVLTLRRLHRTVEQRVAKLGCSAVELGRQTMQQLAHHLGVA
jgi:hypothetical protein